MYRFLIHCIIFLYKFGGFARRLLSRRNQRIIARPLECNKYIVRSHYPVAIKVARGSCHEQSCNLYFIIIG